MDAVLVITELAFCLSPHQAVIRPHRRLAASDGEVACNVFGNSFHIHDPATKLSVSSSADGSKSGDGSKRSRVTKGAAGWGSHGK